MRSRIRRSPGARAEEVLFSLSEDETEALGQKLASRLKGGELILLVGELGVGKTVFVRGLAAGLGIDPDEISSPTFVLISPHQGRLPLYHVDLYRLEDPEEAFGLGIEECLESGVVAVEWGEKLPADLKEGALQICFEDLGEGSRRLAVRSLPRTSDS